MTRANKKNFIVSFLSLLASFFSVIAVSLCQPTRKTAFAKPIENDSLPVPLLEFVYDYNLLSWSTVSGATFYELRYATTLRQVYSGTSTQYSYTPTSTATSFQVRAGNDTAVSSWSNTVTVQVQSTDPIQLTAPVLSYDSSQNLLSWTATNDGGDYRLYNETTGVIVAETMYTTFTVTESGVYKVKALGDGDSTEDSSWSNSVTVDLSSTPIPLTAPVLSYSSSSNLLSWSYPDGTSFVDHAVVVNSNGSSKQYSTSVSGFSPSESGIYNVYLVSKSGSGYSDSAYSNSVTVTFSSAPDPSSPTKLASPVLSYDSSQNLLSWTTTNDGGDYQLYNETTGSIATETMLTDFYPSVSGVYKVKALGDGDSTEDSAWSNTVLVSVPESILSSPSLNLSGKVLSWTSSGAGITYEVNNVTTGDTYTTQSLTFTVSVLGIYRVRATGDPGSGWSNTVFVDISSGSDRYGLGYNDGYAAGLADGMLKASEGGGLRDLFLSIGDVPLHVIDGLLGGAALEDVFGFNLKTTFLTILVVLIIALLVRKFVGL